MYKYLVSTVESLKKAMARLSDDLNRANKEKRLEATSSDAMQKVIGSLEHLILSRIDILRSFELLSSIDLNHAEQLLLRRYLGGVCPDTKFGGYEFELCDMLDDYRLAGGDLEALVKAPLFDRTKLGDPRVIRSFCEALDFDSANEFEDWLLDAGVGEVEWRLLRLLNLGAAARAVGFKELAADLLTEAEECCAGMALEQGHPYLRLLQSLLDP